ncbi:TaqI-like C-terminal specificity domain-containing protein [Clostridium kluyveri]|uniref:TaqI-like C-terminal specificity domain-containing protein n=1 Tax=Clostridium kluyveri TaxID=1534 RepID=UPI00224783B7|nr:TaqI-like C-terminal specificity domain-containing protein [Clostridium kluyveri]UZQ49776.1 N-6 DNA methylase [Clostridium kluyveri]
MEKRYDSTILGEVYEKSMNKSERKERGSFYTPYFIVEYIVENTLSNLDVKLNPFVKVLDPSCGSGYFLLKAYDILMKKFNENLESIRCKFKDERYIIETKNGLKNIYGLEYWQYSNLSYHILKECIYGADLDEKAVELAKINLLGKSGINFDFKNNIICCNSLIRWEREHKEHESSYMGKFWEQKYDYILGNPPWVSLSRKHKKDIEDNLKEYYSKNYEGNTYLPNLYEYFIKRSMEILRVGGRFGFIIPDRLASNLQYKDFRKKLLERYNIINVVFEIKFPEINTDTMIIIAENKYSRHNKIKVNVYKKSIYNVEQNEYIKNLNCEFFYYHSSKSLHIKNFIDKNSLLLGDICKTFTGFIGYKEKITSFRLNKNQVEILKGENIKKFHISNNYYYDFIPCNIKGGTSDIKKLTSKNKIIIRKTGKHLIAALDTKGSIIEQSLYGIICLDKRFSPYYILGLLNSKLIQWYYVNFLITNANSTPQIKKFSLDRVPIINSSDVYAKNIEKLVSKLIHQREQNDILEKKLDESIFELYNIDYNYRSIILKDIENMIGLKKGGNNV